MVETWRRFDRDFRERAVRIVLEPVSRSQAARDLGIKRGHVGQPDRQGTRHKVRMVTAVVDRGQAGRAGPAASSRRLWRPLRVCQSRGPPRSCVGGHQRTTLPPRRCCNEPTCRQLPKTTTASTCATRITPMGASAERSRPARAIPSRSASATQGQVAKCSAARRRRTKRVSMVATPAPTRASSAMITNTMW